MMSKWKHISSLVRSKALVPQSTLPSSYTFTPNKEEVIESRFRLRYSTTCNSYYRDWSDAIDPSAQGVLTGWDKALYSVDSVHRKINEEVGQVYLERVSGSNTGCVKWRFNFGCCGLLVDEVTIRLSCVEDFGGEVVVTLMGNPAQKRVRYPIGSDYVTYTELENSAELTLTVHFVGEAGQVTRLFPQSILRGMGYPLDIQVILKPPLQSLGRPRILVGLLYSSSQENEVDSRHYKQNTTNTGQGFLHIHLLRAKDLPQGKHGLPDAFLKSYLLPDAKKSSKCRTKTRKGKDPWWNEQFLIVGVNYHNIKRRALEICIADSHTSVGKKAKYLGGVRLSLGYKAVVAAETKQVSQVLRFLKAKPGGVSGGMKSDKEETVGMRERKVSFSDKDTVIANVNSSFVKWRKASASGNPVATITTDNETKAEIAKDAETTEKKAKNNTEGEQITSDDTSNEKTSLDATKANIPENEPQSASSTSTEDMTVAWDSVPDPTTNSPQDSDASPETCNVSVKSEVTHSTNAVENTTMVIEVSCDSSDSMQVDSKNNRLVEERLFRSVMTSIKQLDFEARYGAMPEDCNDEKQLECFNEHNKVDEPRGVNSCANNDFEKGEVLSTSDGHQKENVGKEEFVKQESGEISSQIIENNAEKENNALNEIEALEKGVPAEDSSVLNDINTANEINETGKGNSPDLSENSRNEDDQKKKNDLGKIETQNNGDLTDEGLVLNAIKEVNVAKNAESEKENPPNSSENSRNEDDQKKNDLGEIETQNNGDLTNEGLVLNAIKEVNVVKNAESEKENPPNSSENSRTEHDQKANKQNGEETCPIAEEVTKQNGDETRTRVEDATKQEKTTKVDSLLKNAVTETRGSVKSIEGKCNNTSEPRNEEIKADSLEIEHTKVPETARKIELKHSSSFSLKDFGKKLSFRRRSKSESEENGSQSSLETNANKLMLDAQGLEITQWKLVVDQPKQWHYCWHILRPDMTILH